MSDDYRMVARAFGGAEQIVREPLNGFSCKADEVLVRVTAIGVNFIDTYHRSGLYPQPLPARLGSEAAGVVAGVGSANTGFVIGDRVAMLPTSPGTYATMVVQPADRLVAIPDAISDQIAAASLLKGLTAWMLAEPCGRLRHGDSALVHAAAGGVGLLAVQWLKALDVTVIAHAGTPAKAARAQAAGADHALSCPLEELAAQVRALTGGRGVEVVLDGVGAASWPASLAATARRGLIVTYGNASGPVPPFAPQELNKAGSLFVTRPKLYDYLDEPGSLQTAASRLFEMIADGALTVEIGHRFPLKKAGDAHRAIESRQTTGSTILLP